MGQIRKGGTVRWNERQKTYAQTANQLSSSTNSHNPALLLPPYLTPSLSLSIFPLLTPLHYSIVHCSTSLYPSVLCHPPENKTHSISPTECSGFNRRNLHTLPANSTEPPLPLPPVSLACESNQETLKGWINSSKKCLHSPLRDIFVPARLWVY